MLRKSNLFTVVTTLFILLSGKYAQSGSLLYTPPVNRSPFLNLKQYEKYMGTFSHFSRVKIESQKKEINHGELINKVMSLKILGILIDTKKSPLSLIQSPDGSIFLVKKGENIGDGVIIKDITTSGIIVSVPIKKNKFKIVVLKYKKQKGLRTSFAPLNGGANENIENSATIRRFALPRP